MLKCSTTVSKVYHLIQKQLPDPGEGALGVDGAGVWKKVLLLNSIKCLQLCWLYSTGRLLWFNNFLKLIIRTSYNIENTSNMEK